MLSNTRVTTLSVRNWPCGYLQSESWWHYDICDSRLQCLATNIFAANRSISPKDDCPWRRLKVIAFSVRGFLPKPLQFVAGGLWHCGGDLAARFISSYDLSYEGLSDGFLSGVGVYRSRMIDRVARE